MLIRLAKMALSAASPSMRASVTGIRDIPAEEYVWKPVAARVHVSSGLNKVRIVEA